MTAKVTSLDFGMQAPKSRTRHSPSLRPNLPGTSSTQSQFARDTIILCCLTMLVACTHEDIIFIQNPSHSCASSVLPPFHQPPRLELTSLSKLPPTLSSQSMIKIMLLLPNASWAMPFKAEQQQSGLLPSACHCIRITKVPPVSQHKVNPNNNSIPLQRYWTMYLTIHTSISSSKTPGPCAAMQQLRHQIS